MVVLFTLLCLLITNPSIAAEEKQDNLKTEPEQTLKKKEKPKAVFYELVNDNIKPDSDEFYVSSIYKIQDTPRALIKRSTNKRAGDLYVHFNEYGIGDSIGTDYKIADIDTKRKEIIVEHTTEENKFYGLTVSYGKAKSRLVPKPNYKPAETSAPSEATEAETKKTKSDAS